MLNITAQRFLALCLISGGLLLQPGAGQAAQPKLLDQLEGGRWELQTRNGDSGTERICLRDGSQLIQLRHSAESCERRVVSDTSNEVTIQYTCRGKGYGRTQVRRETSRLIQIETQGIAGGLPFSYEAEGRRIGNCGG